ERYRFGCDDVHQRAALGAWEYGFIDGCRPRLTAHDHAAARSAQRLVRRRRDEVRMRYRAWVQTCCHETCDMRHVDHEQRAYVLRDLAELLEVDDARICAGTGDDQARAMLEGCFADFFVVDRERV